MPVRRATPRPASHTALPGGAAAGRTATGALQGDRRPCRPWRPWRGRVRRHRRQLRQLVGQRRRGRRAVGGAERQGRLSVQGAVLPPGALLLGAAADRLLRRWRRPRGARARLCAEAAAAGYRGWQGLHHRRRRVVHPEHPAAAAVRQGGALCSGRAHAGRARVCLWACATPGRACTRDAAATVALWQRGAARRCCGRLKAWQTVQRVGRAAPCRGRLLACLRRVAAAVNSKP